LYHAIGIAGGAFVLGSLFGILITICCWHTDQHHDYVADMLVTKNLNDRQKAFPQETEEELVHLHQLANRNNARDEADLFGGGDDGPPKTVRMSMHGNMAGFGMGAGSPDGASPLRPRISFAGSAAESHSDWDGLENLMAGGGGRLGSSAGDGYLNFGVENEFSQFQGLDFGVGGGGPHSGNDIMY
jgi:hypothetical protein